MKKLFDWIKDIFIAIWVNWKLFLFFHSKKKQKKFEEEMKEIIENVKRKEILYQKNIKRKSKNKLKNKREV